MGPQLVSDARFRHLVWQGKRPEVPARAGVVSARLCEVPDDPPLTRVLHPDEAALVIRVLRRAGLDPHAYRSTPFQRRIPACLRALSVPSAGAALAAMARDPGLYAVALEVLVNATTSMFRDRAVFNTMRALVIPHLAASCGPRILSVGCSTGAELASVAVLLDQAGALQGADLHGIDCRPAAINAARRGAFSAREIAAVPPTVRSGYLSQTPGGWSLPAHVRSRLNFHVADALGSGWPAGPWDLVLCRNLAIYLGRDVAANLWRRLTAALCPPASAPDDAASCAGGYLVVGHAERVPPDCGLVRRAPCIYRRERN